MMVVFSSENAYECILNQHVTNIVFNIGIQAKTLIGSILDRKHLKAFH